MYYAALGSAVLSHGPPTPACPQNAQSIIDWASLLWPAAWMEFRLVYLLTCLQSGHG